MKKKTTPIVYKRNFFLVYILIFSVLFSASACHCDQEPEKQANNKVLALKFNGNSNEFLQGKEYKFFNETERFTLLHSKEVLENETISKIIYKETNALIFKATSTIYPTRGEIIIPEDFISADNFQRVTTDDFVSPQNGYSEMEEYDLAPTLFMELWSKVQNLEKVRDYLQSNPEQEIKIFLHKPFLDNDKEHHWIFFLKN